MKLTYRKALETDLDYLLWLRKITMNQYLIDSGILLSEEEQLLRVLSFFEQAKIIISNEQNIGFLKLDEKEDMVEIVQIQIEPKFQGKGIGKQVIKDVIERALDKGKKIFLSVLKVSPARELYLRIGFKTIKEDESSFIMLFDNKTDVTKINVFE